MTHSKEPWFTCRRDSVVCAPGTGASANGGARDVAHYGGHLVAESVCPEDARRIVACINALAGVPTETLEALTHGGAVVRRLEFGIPGEERPVSPVTWTKASDLPAESPGIACYLSEPLTISIREGETSADALLRELRATTATLATLHNRLIGDDKTPGGERLRSEVLEAVRHLAEWAMDDHLLLIEIYRRVDRGGRWPDSFREGLRAEFTRIVGFDRSPIALLADVSEAFPPCPWCLLHSSGACFEHCLRCKGSTRFCRAHDDEIPF